MNVKCQLTIYLVDGVQCLGIYFVEMCVSQLFVRLLL